MINLHGFHSKYECGTEIIAVRSTECLLIEVDSKEEAVELWRKRASLKQDILGANFLGGLSHIAIKFKGRRKPVTPFIPLYRSPLRRSLISPPAPGCILQYIPIRQDRRLKSA